jgi:hypothetical protein
MMGDIYQRSGLVVVWLGSAAHDSDMAIDFISKQGLGLYSMSSISFNNSRLQLAVMELLR